MDTHCRFLCSHFWAAKLLVPVLVVVARSTAIYAQAERDTVPRQEYEVLKAEVDELLTEREAERNRAAAMDAAAREQFLGEVRERRKEMLAIVSAISPQKFEKIAKAIKSTNSDETLNEDEANLVAAVQSIPIKMAAGDTLSASDEMTLRDWEIEYWTESNADTFYWQIVDAEEKHPMWKRDAMLTRLKSVSACFHLTDHETVVLGIWATRPPIGTHSFLMQASQISQKLVDGRLLGKVDTEFMRTTDGLGRVLHDYEVSMSDPTQAAPRYLKEADSCQLSAETFQKEIEQLKLAAKQRVDAAKAAKDDVSSKLAKSKSQLDQVQSRVDAMTRRKTEGKLSAKGESALADLLKQSRTIKEEIDKLETAPTAAVDDDHLRISTLEANRDRSLQMATEDRAKATDHQ